MSSTVTPKKIAHKGNRWKGFHIFYTIIYLYGIFIVLYDDWFVSKAFYPYVTSIMLTFVFVTIIGLWFDKTKELTLRYLFLPTFGFVWVVFTIRLSFEVFDGTEWLSTFRGKTVGAELVTDRIGDFCVHILTLFTGYQILHVFEEELERIYAEITNTIKLLLAYLPYLIILFWHLFYDPFITYQIPENVYTVAGFYLLPPLVLTYTYTIYRTIVKPDDEGRRVLLRFRYFVILLILTILCMGVYLHGWSNLYDSAISWIAYGLLVFVAMRLYFGHRMWFGTVALFPLYGLVMGFYLMREVIFSWLGGNHQPFLDLIQPTVTNGELIYTVYVMLTYTCFAPLIGEIFIMEVPYRLDKHTLLKRAMLRQRHKLGQRAWLHELWNGYGAVVISAAYLFFAKGAQWYFPNQTIWQSILYTLLGMTLVSALFPHMLYRRYIKRAEGL